MSGEACPSTLQGSTAVIPCAHAAGHPPLRDGADRYWAHGTGSLHWDRLRDLDAPVTAASGADRSCCSTCLTAPGKPCEYAPGCASGADQPTLRDLHDLLETFGIPDDHHWGAEFVAHLLPVVERARAEAAAEALEQAADHWTVGDPTRNRLRDQAASLRAGQGGDPG